MWNVTGAHGGRSAAADLLLSSCVYSFTQAFPVLPWRLSWWLGARKGRQPRFLPLESRWGSVSRWGMISEVWILVPTSRRRVGKKGASGLVE